MADTNKPQQDKSGTPPDKKCSQCGRAYPATTEYFSGVDEQYREYFSDGFLPWCKSCDIFRRQGIRHTNACERSLGIKPGPPAQKKCCPVCKRELPADITFFMPADSTKHKAFPDGWLPVCRLCESYDYGDYERLKTCEAIRRSKSRIGQDKFKSKPEGAAAIKLSQANYAARINKALVQRFIYLEKCCSDQSHPFCKKGIIVNFECVKTFVHYVLHVMCEDPIGLTLRRIDTRKDFEPDNICFIKPHGKKLIINKVWYAVGKKYFEQCFKEIVKKYFDNNVEKIERGHCAAQNPNSMHDLKLLQIGWNEPTAFADYMLSEVMACNPNDSRLYKVVRINEVRGFVAGNLQIVLKTEDDWMKNKNC